MGTKTFNNYEDLLTFTRASKGHALRPVSYGDELVSNGTFDTDTSGWTAGNNAVLSVSSNRLRVGLNVTDYAYASQSFATEVGKIYVITFNSWGSNQAALWRLGTALTSNNVYQSAGNSDDNFSWHLAFVAQSATTFLTLYANSTSNTGYAEYDNVSVKEVTFDESDGTLTLFEHPNNIPRVEYDADGNRLGLLVEEARTNLLTYSEDADSWAKTFVTVSQNTTTAPNKTLTADTVTRNNSGADIRQAISVTAGNDYTITIFAKADTDAEIQIDVSNSAFNGNDFAGFNVKTGAFVSGGTGATYSVVDVGEGWRRYSLTATCTNTQNTGVILRIVNDEPVYLWGFQFEQGSFPTSYIKTTGSTATRSADVASIPVADFGFNSDEMTLFVGFQSNGSDGSDYPNAVSMWGDSNASKTIRIGLNQSNTLQSVVANTTNQAVLNHGSYTVNTDSKVALAVKENDFASSASGASAVADLAGTVPALDELIIGGWGTGQFINGHIKSIKYYPRRLTNAQLQDLTS